MHFHYMFCLIIALFGFFVRRSSADLFLRQCEPIKIDMCRGIGYNETSMPNLVGHELQADIELTLQSFAPLIEYVCSTQLKLFLCTAYVPMCTPKVPVPIGPCRSLCESVRSRCHPVLQGFGFPWPPALDCSSFPRENNQETMCMEGPGEGHSPFKENEVYNPSKVPTSHIGGAALECPGISKPRLYVKLHRIGRCAPLCDAHILFEQQEKNLAEMWVSTWTYAAIGLAAVAAVIVVMDDNTNTRYKWSAILSPLLWCHTMVAIGWTVRFVSGRSATSCGYDPQLPNVSLLLIDGLSNAYCASTFLLRYYFGMAACAWWAILCLGWHREVRRHTPELGNGHDALDVGISLASSYKTRNRQLSAKKEFEVTRSNLARFAAWGLPAFQTAAVIVARLVDADELLGACFVGNQSDKGLQILVATPLFCYWIFGSMNLISGYLVHRRNKEILQSINSTGLQHHLQLIKRPNSGIGTFLFIYCVPCTVLLIAVIYEFANIDVWLNVSPYVMATEGLSTPLWPFMSRAFMELMLCIICSAWVLGPKISTMYKHQITPRRLKHVPPPPISHQSGSHASNPAYSTVSYQTVRHHTPTTLQPSSVGTISMKQMSNYSLGRSKIATMPSPHLYVHYKHANAQHFNRYGNETIL